VAAGQRPARRDRRPPVPIPNRTIGRVRPVQDEEIVGGDGAWQQRGARMHFGSRCDLRERARDSLAATLKISFRIGSADHAECQVKNGMRTWPNSDDLSSAAHDAQGFAQTRARIIHEFERTHDDDAVEHSLVEREVHPIAANQRHPQTIGADMALHIGRLSVDVNPDDHVRMVGQLVEEDPAAVSDFEHSRYVIGRQRVAHPPESLSQNPSDSTGEVRLDEVHRSRPREISSRRKHQLAFRTPCHRDTRCYTIVLDSAPAQI
jgi:hypothetical protein